MSRHPWTEVEDVKDIDTGLEDFGHRVVFGASCFLIVRRGFVYRERPPPPALSDAVVCTWRSQVVTPARHHLRVVPDGCTELVYSAGRGLLVYGPGLDWAEVALERHAHFWGIRLTPAAASTVLRVNMTELSGRVVAADDLTGSRIWNRSSLHGWLPSALTVVAERISTRTPDLMTANAAATMTDRPRLSVPRLAKELGVSERHLRRRFIQATGLTPASYRRIARMKSAVAKARTTESPWATIAHDTGFSDQSHLVRELRALTGMSPTELFSGGRGKADEGGTRGATGAVRWRAVPGTRRRARR